MGNNSKLSAQVDLANHESANEQKDSNQVDMQPHPQVVEPTLRAWHRDAAWDLANTSLSYAEIGHKYGRARDTIVKLKNRLEVVRPARAKSGPRPASTKNHLSSAHRAFGVRITVLAGDIGYTAVQELLGVGPYVLSRIKLGNYELSLNVLLRAANVLNIGVGEVVTPPRVLRPK